MEARLISEKIRTYTALIQAYRGPELKIMEVCGTHTMAIARYGLKSLLPGEITLISGPGCPVCVTPVGFIDHAIAIATDCGATITTFGDLLRVPGSSPDGARSSLEAARAGGADIRVVYSPRMAVDLAKGLFPREVVFLGVGFETTAPLLAATVLTAREMGIDNFSMLIAAKTIPAALRTLVGSETCRLGGLLLPGHVSTIIGEKPFKELATVYGIPCAIAGFEPVEILHGLAVILEQIEAGLPRVANCYQPVVRQGGNPKARRIMEAVFEARDGEWRGLGLLGGSALGIRDEFSVWDAARRFDVSLPTPIEPAGCRCGDILQGLIAPDECSLFGSTCTPTHPRGACMVSGEGTCRAHYTYLKSDGQ